MLKPNKKGAINLVACQKALETQNKKTVQIALSSKLSLSKKQPNRPRDAGAAFNWQLCFGSACVRAYETVGIVPKRQEREWCIKLRKSHTGWVSLGHAARQTGVYRPVSQGAPAFSRRKTDRKGILLGHTAVQGLFRNFLCVYIYIYMCFLVPFLKEMSRMLIFIRPVNSA